MSLLKKYIKKFNLSFLKFSKNKNLENQKDYYFEKLIFFSFLKKLNTVNQKILIKIKKNDFIKSCIKKLKR